MNYLTEYIIKVAINGQVGSSHSLRVLMLEFSKSNEPIQKSHYYCINDNFRLPNYLTYPGLVYNRYSALYKGPILNHRNININVNVAKTAYIPSDPTPTV